MTSSDIRPRHADLLDPIVGRGLRAIAIALVLGLVWLVCRVIAPRYEALLMDAGQRPSPTMRGLLIASAYVAKYFWWIAPILVAFFLFSSNGRSRPAARGRRRISALSTFGLRKILEDSAIISDSAQLPRGIRPEKTPMASVPARVPDRSGAGDPAGVEGLRDDEAPHASRAAPARGGRGRAARCSTTTGRSRTRSPAATGSGRSSTPGRASSATARAAPAAAGRSTRT